MADNVMNGAPCEDGQRTGAALARRAAAAGAPLSPEHRERLRAEARRSARAERFAFWAEEHGIDLGVLNEPPEIALEKIGREAQAAARRIRKAKPRKSAGAPLKGWTEFDRECALFLADRLKGKYRLIAREVLGWMQPGRKPTKAQIKYWAERVRSAYRKPRKQRPHTGSVADLFQPPA